MGIINASRITWTPGKHEVLPVPSANARDTCFAVLGAVSLHRLSQESRCTICGAHRYHSCLIEGLTPAW